MRHYALTAFAEEDLRAIWSRIANDSITAAEHVDKEIDEACEFLAKDPMRGHTRREVTRRNFRFWTLTAYPNYTIVYVPGTRPLRIIAVLQGRRNARKILRGRA